MKFFSNTRNFPIHPWFMQRLILCYSCVIPDRGLSLTSQELVLSIQILACSLSLLLCMSPLIQTLCPGACLPILRTMNTKVPKLWPAQEQYFLTYYFEIISNLTQKWLEQYRGFQILFIGISQMECTITFALLFLYLFCLLSPLLFLLFFLYTLNSDL